MTDISASMVMKLRKMSGQGMMDCKRALQEANGDVEQAMGILRKKGLATLAKRAERETTEGTVVSKVSDDGKAAAMATLCCETDFVAKSDDFVTAVSALAEAALACEADEGVDNILETVVDGKKFNDILTETVSKTGEKTQVGDFAKYKLDGPGLISTYIHFNDKVGTMVEIETSDEASAAADILKRTASDIAMHITATKPLSLDKDGIDPEMLEQEKAIFAEQVKNKPAEIIERIVEGKMKKFFAENCLLQQQFVKDTSKTVEQVLTEAAKEAGGEAKIKRFVRFEVG
ncbi:MAG: elongation factor Ts [Phycisphaerae bacterium]|nr:elongation factor Ts [Phycisphaerae bacterium]NIP50697.1 elongation factor Ts [Phycisphaerae bacterium]NIS52382.1 elongation factor Ts [Phycisphaerae bacterium]NIU11943.1 elongation factor Ts [Phycisphaerae bacterium]NIU57588.1 elongation factor Ts [Phycisphaerae bacterium]